MKRTIRLRESELRQMISESVKNILQEHDQEALGRLSARNLEKSADLAKEMGQSGVFPKDKINRMKHHDKMAHKANRLQHELMGLDPDKNFGHLTHPDFGKGFNDVQNEYSKLRSSISEFVKRALNEVMDDYHLDKFCERNPDCGCNCMKCPAFIANYRYNNGLDDEDDEVFESVGKKRRQHKTLNEAFGVDFDDTLRWVQKKNPNMSYDEAEKFATNIIRKREAKQLADKTANVPNTNNHPVVKRFDVKVNKHASGYLNVDIADHQTKKMYGHSFKSSDAARNFIIKTLDWIVKNIPTNTNFYIENIKDKPTFTRGATMFDRLTDFSNDILV